MSLRHALDDDAPVGAELDLRAHPLQEQRELDDLRLGGRVAQHGLALGEDGGKQHRLGRADARVGQRDARAVQLGRLGADPGRPVADLGAEGLQRLDVEVDRAAARSASPPTSGTNASPVRCSSGPSIRIGIRLRPVNASGTRGRTSPPGAIVISPSSRLTWKPADSSIAAVMSTSPTCGRVADDAGAVAQHRGHHVLGHGVLGAAHGDVPAQRPRRLNCPRLRHAVHHMRCPARRVPGFREREATQREL